ncbi:MAG: hypothetical protein Q9219_000742 [cf. Caloplaca sp. 3 TL-2023]
MSEPRQSASSHGPLSSHGDSIDPSTIDTSAPEDHRTSFRSTNLEAVTPIINARFPNIEPLYLTKIFRGTIGSQGLIWLDVGRQDVSGLDFSDIAHLVYCFEVYAQIICIMASPQGMEAELELQHALADYRLRLLKMSNWATFESVKEWFRVYMEMRFQQGQDRPEGWRETGEGMMHLLRKKERRF